MSKFKPVFVRDANNYSFDESNDIPLLIADTPSMTQQHMAEEADINTIVRRFGIGAQLPQGVRVPTFADFGDEVFDFQSAQNAINVAKQSFLAMPADIRYRFANDPQRFVEFCSDEKNLDEMRKLGLAVPAVQPVKEEEKSSSPTEA